MDLLKKYIDDLNSAGLSPCVRRPLASPSETRAAIAEIKAVSEQCITDLNRYFADGPHRKYVVLAIGDIAEHAQATIGAIEEESAEERA